MWWSTNTKIMHILYDEPKLKDKKQTEFFDDDLFIVDVDNKSNDTISGED